MHKFINYFNLILFCGGLLFTSCTIQISGTYSLKYFPKTTLKLNPDSTFEFVRNNPNPYLHPFDHPLENYLVTTGYWRKESGRRISITSQSDSITYPLAEIRAGKGAKDSISHFVFYDNYRDTVRILYVQFADSSLEALLHGTMPDYEANLAKQSSLEFHFYGYRPFVFRSETKLNKDYDITLRPEFRPGFFNKRLFRFRRSLLIDINRHARFRKVSKIVEKTVSSRGLY